MRRHVLSIITVLFTVIGIVTYLSSGTADANGKNLVTDIPSLKAVTYTFTDQGHITANFKSGSNTNENQVVFTANLDPDAYLNNWQTNGHTAYYADGQDGQCDQGLSASAVIGGPAPSYNWQFPGLNKQRTKGAAKWAYIPYSTPEANCQVWDINGSDNTPEEPITINDPNVGQMNLPASSVIYTYSGSNISPIKNDNNWAAGTYTQTSNPNIYTISNDRCSQRIVVDSNNNAYLWPVLDPGNGVNQSEPTSTQSEAGVAGCSVRIANGDGSGSKASNLEAQNINVNAQAQYGEIYDDDLLDNFQQNLKTGQIEVNIPGLKYLPPGSQQTGSGNSGANGGPPIPPAPTCESSDFSLSWIACSIINEMTSIETGIENILTNLLATDQLVYSSKDCNSKPQQTDSGQACIFEAWNNFRTYGNIILVIALLVAVILEAVGGGVVEAYSVRKMLPRILIAAILMNLSIYIAGAMLDVTNVLGSGLFDLITAPFKAPGGHWVFTLSGVTGGLLGGLIGGTLLGATGGVIWALASGHGGDLMDIIIGLLFMVGIPVVLAVLGVVLTILLRIALLDFLVIISPVAFALYCLPNTERYFKEWWKRFVQTLMVYPIVVVVFAMADVTSVIINAAGLTKGGVDGSIGEIFSVVAVIAPLFLIPFAFKMSGGAMSTIGDAVSNYRQKAQNGILGDARDPNSLRSRFKRRRDSGRSGLGISNAQLGSYVNPRQLPFTEKGAEARRGRREAEQASQAAQELENNAIYQHNKANSKFLRAHSDVEQAKKKRDDALAAGNTAEVASWDAAISAASQVKSTTGTRMASTQAWLGTGFDIADGVDGYNEMAKTIAKLTGTKLVDKGDGSGSLVAAPGDATAGVYAHAMDNAQAAARAAGNWHLGGINEGAGYDPEAGLSKIDPYTLATRSKPADFTAKADLVKSHVAAAQAADASGNVAEYNKHMKQAKVHELELTAAKDMATGANRDRAVKELGELSQHPSSSELERWSALSTGTPVKKQVREDFVSGVSVGWDTVDEVRGWRAVEKDVTMTNLDLARRDARGQRQPNPTELEP